jgi:hypothetical protein
MRVRQTDRLSRSAVSSGASRPTASSQHNTARPTGHTQEDNKRDLLTVNMLTLEQSVSRTHTFLKTLILLSLFTEQDEQ